MVRLRPVTPRWVIKAHQTLLLLLLLLLLLCRHPMATRT